MRLHDRRKPVQFALERRQRRAARSPRALGERGDPFQDRADHLVVFDQLVDLTGEIGPGLRDLGEHAGVFAPVVRCQRRAERQAMGCQCVGIGLGSPQVRLEPAHAPTELLMGPGQLDAERDRTVGVVSCHGIAI
jgi:hypothetical protein